MIPVLFTPREARVGWLFLWNIAELCFLKRRESYDEGGNYFTFFYLRISLSALFSHSFCSKSSWIIDEEDTIVSYEVMVTTIVLFILPQALCTAAVDTGYTAIIFSLILASGPGLSTTSLGHVGRQFQSASYNLC